MWNVYIVTCALSQPFSKYLKPTCRGFPSYSFTRLCHSWTLWGFCLRSTLFNKRGRRAMSCSKRASLSSRSMSSEWRKTKSNVHMNKKKNKRQKKNQRQLSSLTDAHILTILILPHLSCSFHLSSDHALLKLSITVKYLCEIPYSDYCKDGLFIDITCLRKKNVWLQLNKFTDNKLF